MSRALRLAPAAVAALALAACASPPAPTTEPAPIVRVETVPTPLPPTINRAVPPELGGVRALVPPRVEERSLPNGLRILIVEHHELPIQNFREIE